MFVNLPRAIPLLAFNCNEPNIFFCSLTLRSHNFLRIQRSKTLKLSLCRFMAKFCFPKVSLWIKLRASFQWLYRVLNLHLNNSLVFNHRKELNQSKVLYFNKSFDFSWLLRVCLSLYNFWKPAKLTEISISINCVWKKIDLSRRQGIYLTQKFRRSIREYKDPLEVRLYFCRFDVNDTQYLMILVRSSNLGGVYSI